MSNNAEEDGPNSCFPNTHMGDLNKRLAHGFKPGQTLSTAAIGGMSQSTRGFCLSLSFPRSPPLPCELVNKQKIIIIINILNLILMHTDCYQIKYFNCLLFSTCGDAVLKIALSIRTVQILQKQAFQILFKQLNFICLL